MVTLRAKILELVSDMDTMRSLIRGIFVYFIIVISFPFAAALGFGIFIATKEVCAWNCTQLCKEFKSFLKFYCEFN